MQLSDFQPENLFAQVQNLVDRLEDERQARVAAETASVAKASLLAIAGKELRQPMESVAVMAERILSGPLSPAQRRDADALAQSTQRLLGALTEVLDLNDLDSGDAELTVERFDLHALIKTAATVLQERAGAKGLMSAVDMAANCPRFIVGDEARVHQVLMDLIETALQSTAEGSIRLYASVNDADYPVTVRFDITDTGAGLNAAEKADLFEISAEMSCADRGLGLPLARKLAEAMGGVVGCESVLGQGTLYWFTFQTVVADDVVMDEDEDNVRPLKAANDDRPKPADMPNAKPSKKGALSGHVLVVEGNTVNRMLIGAYLEEFGLSHEMAETGTAALMCLASRTYDLVLMDTALPDFGGIQMAQRIRVLQAPSAQVPLVALTAQPEKDHGRQFIEAGVNARVAKPIQGKALYAALVPFLPAKDDGEAVVLAS